MGSRIIRAGGLSAGLLLLAACGLAQSVVDIPVSAVSPVKTPEDIMEIQGRLLRFSDELLTSVTFAMEHLRIDNKPLEIRRMLQWKIAFATSTTSIVSGDNPRASLLDMTVFVTLTRMTLETHWQPNVFGESGRPLLEASRHAEEQVWRLTSHMLPPEQQELLRRDILVWHVSNPQPESPLAARAINFAAEVSSKSPEGAKKKSGVLNILSLDPLSGLDPAVRELTQARLLAERALFVAQRMTGIVRLQAELLGINLLDAPPVRQLVADTTKATTSIERLTVVAEKFPETFAKEREEILKAIETQEKELRPMVHEVGLTLDAGTRLSESLNTTVKTVDALLKRLEGPPSDTPKPPSEPFRIEDYTKTALQLEATARQLTELITSIDKTLAAGHVATIVKQVDPAVQRAEAGGKEILDHAFKKAAILVAVILAAAVLYRVISSRIKPAKP